MLFLLSTGKGWYDYEKGSRKPLHSPEVAALIDAHRKEIGWCVQLTVAVTFKQMSMPSLNAPVAVCYSSSGFLFNISENYSNITR